MQLDSLDLQERLRRQITLATTRATDDRHILDDEEIVPAAIATGYMADLRPHLTAEIAGQRIY